MGKLFDKSELPENTVQLISEGKVTYRGCGMGKNCNNTRIKIQGKEYMITDDQFVELGGHQVMKFNAPFRKFN